MLVRVMSLLSRFSRESADSPQPGATVPVATEDLQALHVGSAQAPVEGSDQLFGTEVSEPGEEVILDAPALTS
jgi:hypothetical protein